MNSFRTSVVLAYDEKTHTIELRRAGVHKIKLTTEHPAHAEFLRWITHTDVGRKNNPSTIFDFLSMTLAEMTKHFKGDPLLDSVCVRLTGTWP